MGDPIRSWETRKAEQYWHRESPPDAEGESYHAEYSERGKATYRGKDVTEGRSPPRKLMPDTVGSDNHQPPSLPGIANKARVNKRHRLRDWYRGLNAELWMHCWQALHKGAASGVDQVTAAGYAEPLHANMEAWAQRLQTQRFRAKLVRRCDIPKEHGQERPLGMPALEDKWVHLACAQL